MSHPNIRHYTIGEAGKGSRQRPYDKKKFDSEFERIFGKKKESKEGK